MKLQPLLLISFFSFSLQIGIASNNIIIKKNELNFDSLETIFQRIQNYSEMEITVNFDSLTINRRKDTEHSAKLVLKGNGQEELSLTTKIRSRGRFRRMKCDWAPMRLNFDKSALKALNLYQKYDKLKLVTHCNQAEADAQVLLKEYWTYKLYNELTDSSFQVHLLKVTYINEADTINKIHSYAILIENNEELAHRLNGELVEGIGISVSSLSPTSYHNVLLFNYMVGNTDWKLKLQKNLKLIKHSNSDLYTIVPYDFDFSKIVDPPYLRINQKIPSLDKYNRAALGYFSNKESLENALVNFNSLRKNSFIRFQKCPLMTNQTKKEMSSYLKSFFKKAKDKEYMEMIFLDGK